MDPGARLRGATTHSDRSTGEEDQLLIANVIKGEVRGGAGGCGGCGGLAYREGASEPM